MSTKAVVGLGCLLAAYAERWRPNEPVHPKFLLIGISPLIISSNYPSLLSISVDDEPFRLTCKAYLRSSQLWKALRLAILQ